MITIGVCSFIVATTIFVWLTWRRRWYTFLKFIWTCRIFAIVSSIKLSYILINYALVIKFLIMDKFVPKLLRKNWLNRPRILRIRYWIWAKFWNVYQFFPDYGHILVVFGKKIFFSQINNKNGFLVNNFEFWPLFYQNVKICLLITFRKYWGMFWGFFTFLKA